MKALKSIIGGSNDEIKEIRVANKVRDFKDESEMTIQKLKMEFRALQNAIEETLDLGPKTTTDLTNLKNVNVVNVLNTVYESADKMFILARKIKIRVRVHNILFPDSLVEDLTENDLSFLSDIVENNNQ